MGAILTMKCPHPECLTDQVSMRIVSSAPGTEYSIRNAYLQCPNCLEPVCARLRCVDEELAPTDWEESLEGEPIQRPVFPDSGTPFRRGWALDRSWPMPPLPNIPEHLPAAVRKAFAGAEVTFNHRGLEEQTAGGYGRALDIGTKLIAAAQPEAASYEKKMIAKRLELLADNHRITPELHEWARHISVVRNSALHDITEISRSDLTALRGFTEMILRYLFTLPAMLEERKAAAAGQRQ